MTISMFFSLPDLVVAALDPLSVVRVRIYPPLTLISAKGEDGCLTAGTGVRDNHLDELDFKSLPLPLAFEAAS